ncbi:alpha-xenorhabdolysin family binary toxin subunit A [Pseudomonas sp. GG8]
MSNEALSLNGITDDELDKLADNAATIPAEFVGASTGAMKGVNRPPGIVVTKEQIISLRHYELQALALPTTLQDVKNYLKYDTGDGADNGLEPEDFQKSFLLIHKHAQRWDPLRTQLKLVGGELRLFAKDMQVYGDSMEKVNDDIEQMKVLKEYSIETLEDVKKLELDLGDKFPGILLNEADKKTASDFSFYLGQILETVEARKNDAEAIKKQLDDFSRDLSIYVLPEIQKKVRLIDTSSLPELTMQLTATIELRAQEIDELNKAYGEGVKKAITTALAGGGLILGIYFGIEADNIRKQRNELMKKQALDIQELQKKNNVLGSLSRVKFDMQDLQTVVLDADVATQNLRHSWNSVYQFIERSHLHTQKIDNALSVRRFMTRFQQVIEPWSDIEKEASFLLEIFNEADEEYKRIYGEQ